MVNEFSKKFFSLVLECPLPDLSHFAESRITKPPKCPHILTLADAHGLRLHKLINYVNPAKEVLHELEIGKKEGIFEVRFDIFTRKGINLDQANCEQTWDVFHRKIRSSSSLVPLLRIVIQTPTEIVHRMGGICGGKRDIGLIVRIFIGTKVLRRDRVRWVKITITFFLERYANSKSSLKEKFKIITGRSEFCLWKIVPWPLGSFFSLTRAV